MSNAELQVTHECVDLIARDCCVCATLAECEIALGEASEVEWGAIYHEPEENAKQGNYMRGSSPQYVSPSRSHAFEILNAGHGCKSLGVKSI